MTIPLAFPVKLKKKKKIIFYTFERVKYVKLSSKDENISIYSFPNIEIDRPFHLSKFKDYIDCDFIFQELNWLFSYLSRSILHVFIFQWLKWLLEVLNSDRHSQRQVKKVIKFMVPFNRCQENGWYCLSIYYNDQVVHSFIKNLLRSTLTKTRAKFTRIIIKTGLHSSWQFNNIMAYIS